LGGVGQDGTRVPGAANGAQAEAGGEKLNPDDYAPAADAGPAPPFKAGVTRGTSAGVPLYRDAAALPGVNIPQLRLDLHVFAAKPQERFVMLNMHKLHEGDTTPEGVRVEEIRPDGAVLSKDGVKFLLPRD
jgi:general secretion pathway protein B